CISHTVEEAFQQMCPIAGQVLELGLHGSKIGMHHAIGCCCSELPYPLGDILKYLEHTVSNGVRAIAKNYCGGCLSPGQNAFNTLSHTTQIKVGTSDDEQQVSWFEFAYQPNCKFIKVVAGQYRRALQRFMYILYIVAGGIETINGAVVNQSCKLVMRLAGPVA